MKEINFEGISELEDPLIIDVRSPNEYQEDHLPKAINLPVLNNKERDEVGTIHNQDSPFKARREGAKYICSNVPDIIDEIDQRADQSRPVVLYCWRGGQRSQSLSIILDRIGYNCYRLEGGYKSFRNQVNDYWREGHWPEPIVTIFGYTGAGKTLLLENLSEQGETVLNLEAAANHRGSAFGGIDLDDQPSQKRFENRLFQQIQNRTAPVFTEGESRKIGKRIIPDPLFKALTSPPRLWLETSRETRVRRIVDEYEWPECRDELRSGIENLKERLGSERIHELKELLKKDQPEEVVRILLEDYYDPAYDRSGPDAEDFDLRVNGDDLQDATEQIRESVRSGVR